LTAEDASFTLLTILIIVLKIKRGNNKNLMITGSSPRATSEASETRCECGQLMAKVRQQGLELKCKRCKRIILIPFTAIEGWTAESSGHTS
jgi:phage FluMu protein Com